MFSIYEKITIVKRKQTWRIIDCQEYLCVNITNLCEKMAVAMLFQCSCVSAIYVLTSLYPGQLSVYCPIALYEAIRLLLCACVPALAYLGQSSLYRPISI